MNMIFGNEAASDPNIYFYPSAFTMVGQPAPPDANTDNGDGGATDIAQIQVTSFYDAIQVSMDLGLDFGQFMELWWYNWWILFVWFSFE